MLQFEWTVIGVMFAVGCLTIFLLALAIAIHAVESIYESRRVIALSKIDAATKEALKQMGERMSSDAWWLSENGPAMNALQLYSRPLRQGQWPAIESIREKWRTTLLTREIVHVEESEVPNNESHPTNTQ